MEREREGQLWEEEVKIEKEAETAEAEAKAEAEAEAEGGLVERWRFQRFSTTATASNGTGHGVFTEQSVGDEAIVIERGKEKDQTEYLYFYLTYTNILCIYRYSFFLGVLS